MLTQTNRVESFSERACDFSLLSHRPIFAVGLSSSYIANGRFISAHELEVWVLDESELAETLRTGVPANFEIDLLNGSFLQGTASVTLSAARIGQYDKRYIEARLCLLEATECEATTLTAKWLT